MQFSIKKLVVISLIIIILISAILPMTTSAAALQCNIPLVAGKIIERSGMRWPPGISGPGAKIKVRAKVLGSACEATVLVAGAVVGNCKVGNYIFAPVVGWHGWRVAVAGGCAPCKSSYCQ